MFSFVFSNWFCATGTQLSSLPRRRCSGPRRCCAAARCCGWGNTAVCNSVHISGASVVAGACSACGRWTAVCHDAQLITRESGIGVLRRIDHEWFKLITNGSKHCNSWPSRGIATTQTQVGINACKARMMVLRRHRRKLASMHAQRE